MSCFVNFCNILRASGPQRPIQARFDVTSATESNSGILMRSHERSCWPKAVPVMIRKRSISRRVMVKSHSMPPRGLSMEV